MRTAGTVNFRLKESSKDEKPIFLDFSYGRKKRLKYAIGYSVNPKYWTGSEVKNIIAVRNPREINDLIRDLKSEILNFVSDCDSKQITFDNDVLRNHLNFFTNKKNNEENEDLVIEDLSFLTIFNKFIKLKTKELSGGKSNQTVKSYKQTLKQLTEFEFDSNYNINFKSIDNEFYVELVDYLNNKEHKKGVTYSLNTIAKHIKNLKVFMNDSLYNEYHSNLKFKKFKVITEITTAIYLTFEEQKKMFELDLSLKPHYQLARDIFIIGTEIGQRVSDYKDMNKHSIEKYNSEEYVKITQQKTGKQVLCIITPAIREIMNSRYAGKFPPKIAEQKLNKYIKEIGELAKINENIETSITRGGVKVKNFTPKYKLIMSHSARRTYCTLKYKAGIPVHHIMELSGHSTELEFFKYIRNPKEERVHQITSSQAFIDSTLKI